MGGGGNPNSKWNIGTMEFGTLSGGSSTTLAFLGGGSPGLFRGFTYAGTLMTEIPTSAAGYPAPGIFNPADPVGTTSTTLVMAGLGAATGGPVFTPQSTGKVSVIVGGTVGLTALTTNPSITIGLRAGTGAAPANGAASTGSPPSIGAATQLIKASALAATGGNLGFSYIADFDG